MRPLRPIVLLSLLLCACGTGFNDGINDPTGDDDDVFGPVDDDDSTAADDDDSTGDDDDSTGDDDDAGDDDDTVDDFEGDEPGECDDGADNDQDGLFDCDDPNCFGAPVCQDGDDDDDDDSTGDDDDSTAGDDDDSTVGDDDDSTVGDDDDSTVGDDDDSTTAAGAPLIQNATWQWLSGPGEYEFMLAITDPDCNLGDPTLLWTLNGVLQPSQPFPGANLTCTGTMWFNVGGIQPGSTNNFTLQIMDSVGTFSNIWPINNATAN